MTASPVSPSYSRTEVKRLLRLTEAQLRSWERQKLVPAVAEYGFRELVALRTLVQFRKDKVAPQQIRRAIHALRRKLSHIEEPLIELRLFADGKRVRVEVDGNKMEAESGQLLLDFSQRELSRLLEFKAKPDHGAERTKRREAEHWFERGLQLEHNAAPADEVIAAYKKAIELDPRTAGAHVNLGTIFFNARKFTDAERHYKKALDADPEYSLAHFDLANLYDEKGDRNLASEHYLQALRIAPHYADAHYNLALLWQGTGQTMKAVHHWNAYLKLDPSSEWATIARRELTKLREASVLRGSRQSGV